MKKKKILLLLLIMTLLSLKTIKVNASTSFYEAEYIPNYYINRSINGKIHYQQARFMRESVTNKPAYCLEPFTNMNENSTYNETITPRNLTAEQLDKIKKAVFLGYNSNDSRKDNLWYIVTQLKIWQIANPYGTYYFTNSLNGTKINTYDYLLDELEADINNLNVTPSFNGKTFDLIENSFLVLNDTNNVLKNYQINNPNVKISNNVLVVKDLKEGTYTFELDPKNHPSGDVPILFYESPTSQNVITIGNINPSKVLLNITVQKTKITLIKIDADTNTKESAKEASLDGAIYELTNRNGKKIATLEIKNNEATIENISYGTYYLKETQAGTGYTLDPNIYEITISKENPVQELVLKNEVIKAKVTINKEYLKNDTYEKEPNIEFTIYDEGKNIVEKITTDENGHAEIELKYGTYYIEQTSTTPGYNYIEPFYIHIKDNLDLTYNLKNYEIPVPKTGLAQNNKSNINVIILIIIILKRVLF